MKKTAAAWILFCLLLLPAFASEVPDTPQVLVTGYKLENDCVQAGSIAKLTVTLRNMSRSQSAERVTVRFSGDGELGVSGVDTAYFEKIAAGQSAEWTLYIFASEQAAAGEHTAGISAEYDCGQGRLRSDANVSLYVFGKEEEKSPSAVRLLLTSYETEGGGVFPGEQRKLSVKLKNNSSSGSAVNIRLSFTEDSGEITADGMGNLYVPAIKAGEEYTAEFSLSVTGTAEEGRKHARLTLEYEDEAGESYTDGADIFISVIQTVSLDFDSAVLPPKSVIGDTVTMTVNLMNTGKTTLYNCRTVSEVPGLTTGGASFVGTVGPGESAAAVTNFKVTADSPGEVSGTVEILYEDGFGTLYKKTAALSTSVEEKTPEPEEEEKDKKKNSLWWLFLSGGIVAGAGLGFGIPFAIRSAKQRKEDELRL